MKRIGHHWRAALVPCLAALALAVLAGGARAQPTPEQQSAIRSNCRSDFMSKCSGVPRGGKEALECLQKNVASLSPACKTAVSVTIPAPPPVEAKPAQAAPPPAPPPPPPAAAAAPPAPAAAPTPAAPEQRSVKAAPPPPAVPARPAPKPQQAAKPAAPPAQAAVAPTAAPAAAPVPTPQQMKAVQFSCRREFANNCRGVTPGGAEAVDCLQRNAAKLTPDCKTSLAALGDAMPPAAGTPPPPATRTPNAPVVMTAVIGRACMRDLLLHCRDIKVGDGRKIACLMERGPALAPLCRAALKITEPVR